jgi:hypothetical protein
VKKVKKSLFKSDSESGKSEKITFPLSGKSLKVKKVKSESDYFSLSNVCMLHAYIGKRFFFAPPKI